MSQNFVHRQTYTTLREPIILFGHNLYFQIHFLDMGIWQILNFGNWEIWNLEDWEFGKLGDLETGKLENFKG